MSKSSAGAFPCPNCARPLSLSPALDGRRFRCRTCGSILSLTIQTPPRGRRRGRMIVSLVSGERPCPNCSAPLRLVPALQGRRIRCRGCETLLTVSIRPWRLSLVEAESSSQRGEEAVDALPVPPEPPEPEELAELVVPRLVRPVVPPTLLDKPAVAPRPAPEPEKVAEPETMAELETVAEPETMAELETVAEPETAVEPEAPRKASASVSTEEETPFNRHAMDEPGGNSAMAGMALAVLVGLAAGVWWLFSGHSIHPEARYLPATCERFVSIRWSLLARKGIDPTASEAPGLIPIGRCRIFLENAGIEASEVERINVGVAADGEGTLLVYRLTRPIRAEAILDRGPFRDPRKRPRITETAGGVVLYPLGQTALAFPDSRTIVNGETDLLRKTLAGGGAVFTDPLNRLLRTLDFSAPVVIASVGVGEPVQSLLQKSGVQSESISGTTDSIQPGPTVPLLCVLHLRDPRSADSIAQALQKTLLATAQDLKTAEPVRRLLAGSRVSAAEGKVQVQLTAQGEPTAVQSLALLKPLFY